MAMNLHFTKNRKFFFLLSAVIVVLGIVCIILRGFNLDVDFTGGTTFTVSDLGDTEVTADLQKQIENVFESLDGVHVSSFQRTSGNANGFLIKIQGMSENPELRIKAEANLRELLDLEADDISSTTVGATVSGELRVAAIVSSIIAIVLMLLYITFRFDLASGLAAVVCLAHDIFIMLVFYSLLQVPMGSTMIAALLTILGYSINATIIVFDRVRENRRVLAGEAFDETVNLSIRQTMRRSVFTSLTTFATITALYVACFASGITSVTNFALPLMIGILAGFYSSTCLSGNLWSTFRRVIRFRSK